MKKATSFFIAISLSAFLLFSCSNDISDEDTLFIESEMENTEQDRTLIVTPYIATGDETCHSSSEKNSHNSNSNKSDNHSGRHGRHDR